MLGLVMLGLMTLGLMMMGLERLIEDEEGDVRVKEDGEDGDERGGQGCGGHGEGRSVEEGGEVVELGPRGEIKGAEDAA